MRATTGCTSIRASQRTAAPSMLQRSAPAHLAGAASTSACKSWATPRAEPRRAPVTASAALAAAPSTTQTSTHAAAAATSSGTCITVNIHYSTTFGEIVKLVGNWPEAGNWDVEKGKELKWTQGDTWTTTLSLPADKKYEYKFVVCNSKTRTKRWEDGPNRIIDPATSASLLDMEWSSEAVATSSDAPAHVSREELAARAREREHGSNMIFSAFSKMVSQAKPGSIWAAEDPEDSAAAAAAVEAEFAAVVAGLSSGKAAPATKSTSGKASPRLVKAKASS